MALDYQWVIKGDFECLKCFGETFGEVDYVWAWSRFWFIYL